MSLQWNIQVHERLYSTQDFLKNLDSVEGTVVHALRQHAGRGRHGRVWEEGEGNLYLSFVLAPKKEAALMGQLSLLMGVAVYKTVATFIDTDTDELMLKWPNDVLLDGRKCAGILLESDITPDGQIDKLYIGIGVNVAHAPLDIASALNAFTAAPLDVTGFRDKLLDTIKELYTRWLDGDGARVLDEWQACAHAIGSDLTVKIGESVQSGHFHGLDQYGSLILSLGENQFKTITAGEIFLSAED